MPLHDLMIAPVDDSAGPVSVSVALRSAVRSADLEWPGREPDLAWMGYMLARFFGLLFPALGVTAADVRAVLTRS